jgi:hypothetical protein
MARQVSELEKTIMELTTRLDGFAASLKELKENALPEAVDELEWDEKNMWMDEEGDRITVHLPNGRSVTVHDFFHPHISVANKNAAYQWLIDQGSESLLRTEVSLSFRRGEIEPLKKAVNALKEAVPSHEPEIERGIHPQTLAKFCRDKIAEGVDLPETFGLFNRRVAVVELDTRPRGIPAVSSVGYGE